MFLAPAERITVCSPFAPYTDFDPYITQIFYQRKLHVCFRKLLSSKPARGKEGKARARIATPVPCHGQRTVLQAIHKRTQRDSAKGLTIDKEPEEPEEPEEPRFFIFFIFLFRSRSLLEGRMDQDNGKEIPNGPCVTVLLPGLGFCCYSMLSLSTESSEETVDGAGTHDQSSETESQTEEKQLDVRMLMHNAQMTQLATFKHAKNKDAFVHTV